MMNKIDAKIDSSSGGGDDGSDGEENRVGGTVDNKRIPFFFIYF